MADAGGEVGGCCGLFCTGILQQFFNTSEWPPPPPLDIFKALLS